MMKRLWCKIFGHRQISIWSERFDRDVVVHLFCIRCRLIEVWTDPCENPWETFYGEKTNES
jgi:hypothetical protein